MSIIQGLYKAYLYSITHWKYHLISHLFHSEMYNLIVSIFGTDEECIKVNSHTKFAINRDFSRGGAKGEFFPP